MKLKFVAVLAGLLLSTASAQASIIYQFDFTNLSNGATDFSITLTYSNYVTTTGMEALSGSPLPTPLGYSVAYAGTSNDGSWGFDDNTGLVITDSGGSIDSESFLFVPGTPQVNYFTAPGSYTGRVLGNAFNDGFEGNASLIITPIPATVWLFGSGLLLGLIGTARRRKKAA